MNQLTGDPKNVMPFFPPSLRHKTAVVVLSGGQDSVTCLGLALKIYEKVYAVSFAYGQRHAVELTAAALICKAVKVSHTILDLPALGDLDDSALTNTNMDLKASHWSNPDLPASFVPNRNAAMLTLAHAYAQKVGAHHILTGVCETDFSGYPDCRKDFITALNYALNLGSDSNIQIRTPLMHLDKAATFELAERVGFLGVVLRDSRTCYNGNEAWQVYGVGCDDCPACKIRSAGWATFLARRPADAPNQGIAHKAKQVKNIR